jgi:hypothetical protein
MKSIRPAFHMRVQIDLPENGEFIDFRYIDISTAGPTFLA